MEIPIVVCRGCRRPIRWAKTESVPPKNIPLDPEPVPEGNVVVNDRGIAHVLKYGEAATAPTYVSHFTTCPKSREFRR